ncbi:haloacid dehalogenase [Lactococcus hodotermopsidis]|uniref:Haloacid dehalogenase n=1 Tax=Pseudolactococcus hodotermopsidis TaxID=2709157 RepID=A0A6A0BC30_9LACT|nr:Cof-type HAD-IIB family hydrolase [Lactococcus hodotermopsidis]GFH42892.1 haloacid dehalogenase [Lactococcus hodotermopsidis]
MIKLIASDMDGTLLNENMEISAENIAAIKKVQAAGIEFVVATGRSIEEARPILTHAGITCPFITSNGAQIFNESAQNLFTVGIERAKLALAIPIFRKYGIYFEIFTDHGGFTESLDKRVASVAHWLKSTSPNLTETDAFNIAKGHMNTLPITAVSHFTEVVENPELTVLKIFAMGQIGESSLELAKAALSEISGITVTSSGSNNIEVNHIEAQKGQSLAKIAKKFEISLANVVALGDNFNDVSMLKAAGIGIAMGNAENDVKASANFVTLANTEHGVAHAIDKILTKEWQ